ncbi:SDR family oxidoreductase [Photobacterium kasasachensis]|uniref:SDR family oxidoreductase n=1 Tax=Photobacterium kasasachensis TaxID=2910240 RepID=UPI003D0EA117
MKKVLVAGATGYLGRYIAHELQSRGYRVTVVVRNSAKLTAFEKAHFEVIEAEVTNPDSLVGCCNGVDTVISTVGITRQKDGLTYMDVDYQVNKNLLQQARQSGVGKFIYVSALNGEKLKHLKIFQAKEAFVDELKASGLEYCVIRPNGFFSDMAEIFHMAEKGCVYLFGDGSLKGNPIHGEDLAEYCVNAISGTKQELNVGGPQTLTQNEIASIAFEALGTPPQITHIPDWCRVAICKLLTTFTSSKFYGPFEFFLTVMGREMVAPQYGNRTLKEYYQGLNDKTPESTS